MIDDLTTRGVIEPYRLFTARSEYRLHLRQDNPILRLYKKAYNIGMLSKEQYDFVKEIEEEINQWIENYKQEKININNKVVSVFNYLQRPEVSIETLKDRGIKVPDKSYVAEEVDINVKYAGYFEREIKLNEKMKHLENIKIPENMDYSKVPGLRKEIVQKLSKAKPLTLGHALRLEGITPAAITAIMVYLQQQKKLKDTK
jgi:tRNA uridine 5-carboxymethylaminomethyl modification enzyme